jgi:hypothetical protein
MQKYATRRGREGWRRKGYELEREGEGEGREMINQRQAYATQATASHIQVDMKKQLEELQEAKSKWKAQEQRLEDNLRAIEFQLSQEKKRVLKK